MAIPSSNRNAIQTQIKVDNAAHATTADSATTSISASIATTASYALTSAGTVTNATSASYAATASLLLGSVVSVMKKGTCVALPPNMFDAVAALIAYDELKA